MKKEKKELLKWVKGLFASVPEPENHGDCECDYCLVPRYTNDFGTFPIVSPEEIFMQDVAKLAADYSEKFSLIETNECLNEIEKLDRKFLLSGRYENQLRTIYQSHDI